MDLIQNTPKNLTKPYETLRILDGYIALRFVQQFPTLVPSSLPHGDLALMLLHRPMHHLLALPADQKVAMVLASPPYPRADGRSPTPSSFSPLIAPSPPPTQVHCRLPNPVFRDVATTLSHVCSTAHHWDANSHGYSSKPGELALSSLSPTPLPKP